MKNDQRADISQFGLKIENLSAGYSRPYLWPVRSVVIDSINLQVNPGEIAGILGNNGTGKSTLLKAIVGPRCRFGGQVTVNGCEIESGQVAYMPQSPGDTLSPWLTAEKEIALPLRIQGWTKQKWQPQVKKLCEKYQISVPLHRKITELSGGQRVKVALLRALAVLDHKLVVMDEPFEGLDVKSRNLLIQKMKEMATVGIPVLITSHREEDLDLLKAIKYRLEGGSVNNLKKVPVGDGETEFYNRKSSLDRESDPEDERVNDTIEYANNENDRSRHRARAVITGGLIGIVAGLLLWQGLAWVIDNPRLLPAPISVLIEMADLLTEPSSLPDLSVTIGRALFWWLVANLVAIPLGIAIGYDSVIYRLFAPWLSLGRAVPVFALLGMAKGVFPGNASLQTGFLVWLTLFLISLHILAVASSMVARRRLEIAATFGASHWFRIKRIMPYECLPGIFTALEITLPISVVVGLVVEMFIFPQTGIGIDLYNNMDARNMGKLFALILIPGIMSAIGLTVIRTVSQKFKLEL